MTIIVTLEHKDGVVLATDSLTIFGTIKRDQVRKETLTQNVGITAAGLLGAIEDITNITNLLKDW